MHVPHDAPQIAGAEDRRQRREWHSLRCHPRRERVPQIVEPEVHARLNACRSVCAIHRGSSARPSCDREISILQAGFRLKAGKGSPSNPHEVGSSGAPRAIFRVAL